MTFIAPTPVKFRTGKTLDTLSTDITDCVTVLLFLTEIYCQDNKTKMVQNIHLQMKVNDSNLIYRVSEMGLQQKMSASMSLLLQ